MDIKSCLQIRKFFAEFLGTFILVVISKGAGVAVGTFTSSDAANHLVGCLAGGLGVMMAITITGQASGAHVNPAVTVTMVAARRTQLCELPAYLLGQFLGAGLGAMTVLLVYFDTVCVNEFPTNMGTHPGLANGLGPLILDQAVGTFLLLLSILSVVEQQQSPPGLLVGLSVVAIGLAMGKNAGAAINPAVDMIPRFVSKICDHTVEESYFWLIPAFVPYAGALLALLAYRYVVGMRDQASRAKEEAMEVQDF